MGRAAQLSGSRGGSDACEHSVARASVRDAASGGETGAYLRFYCIVSPFLVLLYIFKLILCTTECSFGVTNSSLPITSQRIRHKALGNCQHLLEQLQKPLTLEQARSFIAEQKNASKKGEIGSKGGPSDPHAAAWLVDEDLWSADKVSGSSSSGGVSGVSGVSGSGDLYVHPAAVQAAAEQHVHALYALRTSSIAPTNTTTNNTTTTSANTTKKHWGAVALPLPLHVVTSTAPTTDTTTPSASLRGSGDWKDLRNSFNRSFDADTTTNTASNAHKGGTSGASEAVVGSLSQRLLTDAKLFRPLASQWAKGEHIS